MLTGTLWIFSISSLNLLIIDFTIKVLGVSPQVAANGVGMHGISSVIGMIGVLVTQRFNHSHFLFHGAAAFLFSSTVALAGVLQNEVSCGCWLENSLPQ